MSMEQIAGTLVLVAQGIAALGWIIVAAKRRQAVATWLACAFVLLWLPVIIRLFPGETYSLEGRRVITASYWVSRLAYLGGYICFAMSAVVALRQGRK